MDFFHFFHFFYLFPLFALLDRAAPRQEKFGKSKKSRKAQKGHKSLKSILLISWCETRAQQKQQLPPGYMTWQQRTPASHRHPPLRLRGAYSKLHLCVCCAVSSCCAALGLLNTIASHSIIISTATLIYGPHRYVSRPFWVTALHWHVSGELFHTLKLCGHSQVQFWVFCATVNIHLSHKGALWVGKVA